MATETPRASQRTGEWTCACGQAYRIAPVDGETRLWPRNSADGYSRHGLTGHARCVRCARSLGRARV
jgi:hypothetical protein